MPNCDNASRNIPHKFLFALLTCLLYFQLYFTYLKVILVRRDQRSDTLIKECVDLLGTSADVKLGVSELQELVHCHAELRISCDPLEKIIGPRRR